VRTTVAVEVDGRRLELSNLDKVLYPAVGFTKGQVIDYYRRAAPVLLPHLSGRPLTLKRYPNGVDEPYFYEKECPRHRPEWVKTAGIWSESSKRQINYCLVEDLPTLIWAANLADLELHPSLSRAGEIGCPTMVIFDLDPGAPATIVECARVALALRELLLPLGLAAFPKTSGSKGIQVCVPLNTPTSYAQTKPFARALAELLQRREPGLVVANMAKSLRPGKVLVDWSQNDAGKTTVCVYSLRARERPTVSMPVTWEEVERGDAEVLSFSSSEALERIEQAADLFAPLNELEQRLPPV